MNSQPLLEIIEDLAPQELFAQACQLSAAKGWYFGHGSREGDASPFWKMDLDGIAVFQAIWDNVRARCEAISGVALRVIRVYANGHTYGLGGQPHIDDDRPGTFTLLYYPMSEWKESWDGETVFYDADGEVALAVRPRPNRAVLFDSRILHAGRAPSRICQTLRVTVAYKLVADVDASIAERASGATGDAAPTPPAVSEGASAERTFSVKIPTVTVRERVATHLAKMGESVRLPGFRPGKVPMAVLEKRYGQAAQASVIKQLADEAAGSAPHDCIVAAVEYISEPDHAVFRVTSIHPPSLPAPNLEGVEWERLSASDDHLREAGLTSQDLQDYLKQQVLDYLDRTYQFPLPGGAVDREFEAIWAVAKSRGQADESDAPEFRRIAERRVRLGIVVAELARRESIAGPGMEDRIVNRLLAQASVRERTVTSAELRNLGLAE